MNGSNRWQWEPWRELDRMFRQLEDVFEDFVPPRGGETPRVNVWKNDDGVIVRAEVPGLSKEDLDITVLKNTLTLRGKRADAKEGTPKDGTTWHRRERGSGSFVRSIALPYPVDSGAVVATYENGVLEVKLPRAEAEKPRTVVVS